MSLVFSLRIRHTGEVLPVASYEERIDIDDEVFYEDFQEFTVGWVATELNSADQLMALLATRHCVVGRVVSMASFDDEGYFLCAWDASPRCCHR